MADFFNVISPPEAIDLMSKNLAVVGHEVINTEDSLIIYFTSSDLSFVNVVMN